MARATPTVVLLTAISLGAARGRDGAVLGRGSQKFNRLIRGFCDAALTVGLDGLAGELPMARIGAFEELPIAGLLLAAVGRTIPRNQLDHQPQRAHVMARVLGVGMQGAVASSSNAPTVRENTAVASSGSVRRSEAWPLK